MVPVRVAPARYDEPTRQAILEGQRSGSMPEWYDSLVERRNSDASEGAAGQGAAGPQRAEQQMTRFRDHQRSGTSAARRLGQAVTSAFRGTVLPFSKKWLTGNVVEAIGRTYVSGSGLVLDPLGSQAGIDTTVIALWLGHASDDALACRPERACGGVSRGARSSRGRRSAARPRSGGRRLSSPGEAGAPARCKVRSSREPARGGFRARGYGPHVLSVACRRHSGAT